MKNTIATAALVTVAAVALGAGSAGAASNEENARSIENFSRTVGAATATGTIVGTGIGLVGGCLFGAATALPTGPGALIACGAGAIPGAALGALIGTVVIGGPVAVLTLADVAMTGSAAPHTTGWDRK